MVSLSPPLCAQLLRPRCCRCEVSSTSSHCSSSHLVNIGFSTSQAHDLFISKSCSKPSASYICSAVADSPLSSTRCDKVRSATSMEEYHFLLFWSSRKPFGPAPPGYHKHLFETIIIVEPETRDVSFHVHMNQRGRLVAEHGVKEEALRQLPAKPFSSPMFSLYDYTIASVVTKNKEEDEILSGST
ncbi:hypothetical protein YC2023_049200 [Brassica napus]